MKESRTTATEPQLDWSIHTRALWPLSSTQIFLGEAIIRTGRVLCEFWDDDVPKWLTHQDPPDTISAEEAFIGENPIPEAHARYGPHIRALMQVTEYRALFEYGEHPPPARPCGDDDEDEPICRRHWQEAVLKATKHAHELAFARTAIIPVARFIAERALSGGLKTYLRPLTGGEMSVAPTTLWEVGDARQRLSSCTLNLERPFDLAAPATHHLFVDAEDLERELGAIPVDQKANLIPGFIARPTADIFQTSVKDVTAWLKSLMGEGNHDQWTRSRFLSATEDQFGNRAGGVVFDRAWAQATHAFPDFSRPGRRRLE